MFLELGKPCNTQVEKIEGTHYCVYCCRKAKTHTEYGHPHNNEPDVDYRWCDCASAIAELKMNQEIQQIHQKYQSSLRINRKGLEDIRYNQELRRLNSKYNR